MVIYIYIFVCVYRTRQLTTVSLFIIAEIQLMSTRLYTTATNRVCGSLSLQWSGVPSG